LFFLTLTGASQSQSRFDFFIGYGFYEGIHIGSEYFLKSKTQSISLVLGGFYQSNHSEKYYAITPSYNIAIFRKRADSNNLYKWHLNNKFVFWQLEDEYYKWMVVSFIPTLCRQFSINQKIKISIDAGPSMNLVLYNERRTYKEVGWPYHVYPNFSVRLIF
jgi:hypothetical protein